jgi:putative ABC transport system permease protein
MNFISIAYANAKANSKNYWMTVLLFAFGIAIITLIFLINHQLEKQLNSNSAKTDLVVGAKGSPLQLILSAIYHIDNPTGNVKIEEAIKIVNNPLLKTAIPVSLGDSYQGFRIVGTNQQYVNHFNLKVLNGDFPSHALEATLGYDVAKATGLKIGDKFTGSHGLEKEALHQHDDLEYKVVGILEKSAKVHDKLIITDLESVWLMHESHDEDEHHHHHEEEDHHLHTHFFTELDAWKSEKEREITALLITYKAPTAVVNFPRFVNANTNLQAASPAFETARLLTLLTSVTDIIKILAGLIILIASLSIFSGLYNTLKDRKNELSVMRTLGASKSKLFLITISEGIIITTIGLILGLFGSHLLLLAISSFVELPIEINFFSFIVEELYIAIFGVLIGLVASSIPAFSIYSKNIAESLPS